MSGEFELLPDRITPQVDWRRSVRDALLEFAVRHGLTDDRTAAQAEADALLARQGTADL